jgi:UDP-N-acetylmuramoyl-L-alanyl-D-glutamate--2,6-diaminopimelate ligase
MNLDKILKRVKKLIPKKIFKFFQPYYHLFLAVSGNMVYGFPGKKMVVIGITGTNGKSTTSELVNAVLKENGLKTVMLSTVAFEIAGKRTDNTTSRTTLGRWQLQSKLAQAVKAGCTHAVLEVASEGIAWHRVWGIPFDVAVFTNLSPEHLNFHKTMENYRNTKGRLFAGLAGSRSKGVPKTIIVNKDDSEAKYFLSFPADQKITYGITSGDVFARNMSFGIKTDYEIIDGENIGKVKSCLPAKFNIYNALAAYSVGKALGLEPNKIVKGIESVCLVEGRMEEVPNKRGIKIFVDYAVTPDAFELVFTEVRKITSGKVFAVFGATGDRDKEKRPLLGEVAARLTDYIILTDEESYSENPAVIVDAIAEGVKKVRRGNWEIVLARDEAIEKALRMAEKGDSVVITGMGHQKYRNLGGDKKVEWDEVKVIEKELLRISADKNKVELEAPER